MNTATGLDPQGPPLPGRQVMHQWWRDVVFVHWSVDPDAVAPLLPAGVAPDLYDDQAWVGLVAFRMVDAGLGQSRPIPRLGTFLETNVRTYSVDPQGRRGVVFRSLDCDRSAVVVGARASFAVPYEFARISHHRGEVNGGDRVRYETTRRTGQRPRNVVEVEVGEEVGPVEVDSLENFLTARFGLHTSVLGRTAWVPNTHGPWPLRRAEVVELDDELVAAAGLPGVAGSRPASVLFSEGVRTVFGLPRRVR